MCYGNGDEDLVYKIIFTTQLFYLVAFIHYYCKLENGNYLISCSVKGRNLTLGQNLNHDLFCITTCWVYVKSLISSY